MDAAAFFARVGGMEPDALAARGRAAAIQQQWLETAWYRQQHTFEQLAADTAEIFGLLAGHNEQIEAIRQASTDMVQSVAVRRETFMESNHEKLLAITLRR